MKCYRCGSKLGRQNICLKCGAPLDTYRLIVRRANSLYNSGHEIHNFLHSYIRGGILFSG